jgi:hypothetical protein
MLSGRTIWAAGVTMILAAAATGCAGTSAPKAAVANESPSSPARDYGPTGGYRPPSAAPAPPGAYGGGGDDLAQAAPAPATGSRSAPSGERAGRAADERKKESAAPEDRPGLGTEWGETRRSSITTVPFVRADPGSPFATTSLWYNDEEGARAMANAAGYRRFSGGTVNAAGSAVQVGLRDEGGRFLSGFVAGGKSYIVGDAGKRYTIVVKNRTDLRFEVVMSVDGLDVLDGKAASFGKRGYLVEPHGELEVDGWRQSTDAVAAFRFGSVRGSYAGQKHGDTRNVGVIGFAFFHERGTNPWPWTRDEVERRQDANPFPGQYATPP